MITNYIYYYKFQVNGFVEDVEGKKVATLFGKWDDSMYYGSSNLNDCTSSSKPSLLWKRTKPPLNLTRYNLTSFAITLNELTSGLQVDMIYERSYFTCIFNSLMHLYSLFIVCLIPGIWSRVKEKLPPTDSRLRPDQRHLENGEYEKANSEKQRLEKRQRMVCLADSSLSLSLSQALNTQQWLHQSVANFHLKYISVQFK